MMTEFKPGDVLSYVPKGGWHAREGTAVVMDSGRAVDTFWHSYEGDSLAHILSADEMATAEVKFSLNDYETLGRYTKGARAKWETYHPDDRGRIPSQHGLQEELYVRKGAQPDMATQIANAEERVAAAEREVQSAQGRLDWLRDDLAKLRESLGAKAA